MKKDRRDIEVFSMSFLDVISCGFGAVILLLVLSLALEPTTIQKITKDLRGLISQRNDAREQHIQESQALTGELAGTLNRISAISKQIDALKQQFDTETTKAVAAE